MDQTIKQTLTGNTTCKLNNEKDLLSQNPQSYTATISGVNKVYSLFPGTVLFLGFYKGVGTLSVAVSNHEIVRYLNLTEIQEWSNSKVETGTYLGTANSRTGLQIEYCTQWKGESKYPVRINTDLYFKQNPIDILNGIYTPTNETDIRKGITRPNDIVTFTDDQKKEWESQAELDTSHEIDPDAFQITSPFNVPESARYMLSDNGGGRVH